MRITPILLAALFTATAATPTPNYVLPTAQAAPAENPNLACPVNYDSLETSVKKAFKESYKLSPDSKYRDFSFHLESSFNIDNHTMVFNLTAEYRGEKPFTDEINLTYITCGATLDNDHWRVNCFPPPKRKTISGGVTPGEIIHQQVEIKYSPGRISDVRFLAPHVDIFFEATDEPQTTVGQYHQK